MLYWGRGIFGGILETNSRIEFEQKHECIPIFGSLVGLTATTASPMVDYGRGHSFFLKMAMVAEF